MWNTHAWRHQKIANQLNTLVETGILTEWQSQSDMPGKLWSLYMRGYSRRYTTSQVEDFLFGVFICSEFAERELAKIAVS